MSILIPFLWIFIFLAFFFFFQKKKDMPTAQQRRKHQISYLAFQVISTPPKTGNKQASSVAKLGKKAMGRNWETFIHTVEGATSSGQKSRDINFSFVPFKSAGDS